LDNGKRLNSLESSFDMKTKLSRRKFIQTTSIAAVSASSIRTVQGAANWERPIRIAQIGTRHSHAGKKWQTVREMPDQFEALGVFEPSPENRRIALDDSDFANTSRIQSRQELLDLNIEAVLVETDLPDLIEWAQFSLESGWHVHVDKPAGRDLKGLDTIQGIASKRKLTLQMGYMFRYHPAFRFCLDAVKNGWLGRIFSIHGEISKAIDPDRRPHLEKSYGGSMMLLGCHLLDLAIAILGPTQYVRAFNRSSFPKLDRLLDHEIAVLEYPTALATIRSSLLEVGGGERRQLVISGENGTIEVRPLEPARVRLSLLNPISSFKSGEQEVPIPSVEGRYDEQLFDFHSMIKGKPSSAPQFSPDHDRLLQDTLVQLSAS
jgi:predicted dehydrogenase